MLDVSRLAPGAAALGALFAPVLAHADEPARGDVVVPGGPKRARAPKDDTVAGDVIAREALAAPGAKLGDALRLQPGLQVTDTGGQGAASTASIRGATPAQLPVYLAGVRLNDDIAGSADLSRVPLWLVERVEVYRGNAPIEADRLGIAGAIFVEPRWPRGRAIGAGARVGSYGTRGAWTYASLGNRDDAVLAGASADAATNDYTFVDDHGTLLAPGATTIARLTNADVTTYDAWLLGRSRLAGGRFDAFANVTTREQGAPTLAIVPSRAARVAFDRAIAGARATMRLGDTGTLEAQSSFALARTRFDDPLEELALLARRVVYAGERATERLALRLEPTPSLAARVAVDVSSETLHRDTDTGGTTRARRLSSRVAATARQWIGERLSLQALGALSCDGTSAGAASTCDTAAFGGRAGAAWTDDAWSAFVNVGRYVRVPTLGELYGMGALVRGNPSLWPESGVSVDAGLRTEGSPRAWGAAFAFARWSDDLVEFVRSAQGYVTPINVARARTLGFEAQGSVVIASPVSLEISATLLDARDTTPGRLVANDVLPFQSRLVVTPRVIADKRDLRVWVLRHARAELRLTYQSSRYADAAGLAVIPEQSSLDAEVLLATRDDAVAVRARGVDLADTRRVDVVGYPLPGRSLFVSLEATW